MPSADVLRVLSGILIVSCILGPLLLWIPICSNNKCVTPIRILKPYFVSSDNNPTQSSICRLRFDPGSTESLHTYTLRYNGGIGVGVQYRNGTTIHRFWHRNGTTEVSVFENDPDESHRPSAPNPRGAHARVHRL